MLFHFCFFKQKTAYEMRISDWSSDVCSSDLSMKSVWQDANGSAQTQTAPVSLIITAFAPVADVRASLTPQLRGDVDNTRLVLVDLGAGKNRLGGSALAQVYNAVGDVAPDLDDARRLRIAFEQIQSLNADGKDRKSTRLNSSH